MNFNTIWIRKKMDKRDEAFSQDIINHLAESANSVGVKNFSLEISEKYDTEKSPHYSMKVNVISDPGLRSIEKFDQTTEIKVSYVATSGGKDYRGKIKVLFQSSIFFVLNEILGSGAFFLYDDAKRDRYYDWKTTYIVTTFEKVTF